VPKQHTHKKMSLIVSFGLRCLSLRIPRCDYSWESPNMFFNGLPL